MKIKVFIRSEAQIFYQFNVKKLKKFWKILKFLILNIFKIYIFLFKIQIYFKCNFLKIFKLFSYYKIRNCDLQKPTKNGLTNLIIAV